MATATEGKKVGRKKRVGPPQTKAVKLDVQILTRAKLIAADRGMTMSDYLTVVCRGAVDRDWTAFARRLGKATDEGGEGGGK